MQGKVDDVFDVPVVRPGWNRFGMGKSQRTIVADYASEHIIGRKFHIWWRERSM